jgi:ribosomal protein S18 acetylase RimI-like enzyme
MATRSLLVFEPRHIEPALALFRGCAGVGLSVGDTPPEIAGFLARNPGFSAVIETPAGSVVGAILAGHDGRRGFLYHLAVHPDERRRGLGQRLVDHCLDAFRAAGISRVSIHVFGDNRQGAEFWDKLGWRMRPDLSVLQYEL